MHTLFLNLASHDSLIACTDDQSAKASASVHTRISDAELISMVESVLDEAGWEYRDIGRIACIVGPGGFTSLRVAVTFTNVLCDQLGIPSAGAHLSELYRARVRDGAREVYWFHSTKKDQLFIRGGKWDEPTLIFIEEIENGTLKIENWVGELINEHRAIIKKDPIDLLPITDVLPKFLASQSYEKQTLTPWYGRGW